MGNMVTGKETAMGLKLRGKKDICHVMIPTFGRDYIDRDAVLDAWEAGATFRHECGATCLWGADYANNVDLRNYSTRDGVQIRYNNNTLSTLWMPEELSLDKEDD